MWKLDYRQWNAFMFGWVASASATNYVHTHEPSGIRVAALITLLALVSLLGAVRRR